jgi:hypothetical protein
MNVNLRCPRRRWRPRRLLLAVGLALAVLAPAVLSGPAAGAQPPPPMIAGPLPPVPPISPIQGRTGGTEADFSFTTAEPTTARINYKPMAAGAASDGEWQEILTYSMTHEVKLTGLTSNTGYDVFVTAETSAGTRLNAYANFHTLKKRVRLVLDEITILHDGDLFGTGEPTWFWSVEWDGGTSGGCFPNTTPSGVEHLSGVCQAGSYGEGTFVPRNDRNEKLALTFAEENFPAMPESFTLTAWSSESDFPDPLTWLVNQIGCCSFTSPDDKIEPWPVPQPTEWSSTPITRRLFDEVESTMLFRFDVFYDNVPYPPNHGRAQVHSNF